MFLGSTRASTVWVILTQVGHPTYHCAYARGWPNSGGSSMAKPIVSLPAQSLSNSVQGSGSFYWYRQRSKQARPYGTPAPYRTISVNVTGAMRQGTGFPAGVYMYGDVNDSSRIVLHQPYGGSATSDPFYVSAGSEAKNQALADFLGKIRSEAMLAVNWVEREQAVAMLSKRALQLARFTRALRRGDLLSAADALVEERYLEHRNPRKRKRYQTSKWVADSWLEFHFGWAPLVQDIFTCVNILQQPVAWPTVIGKSRHIPLNYYARGTPNGPYREFVTSEVQGFCRARCGAVVSVNNPNLWLANQLGLVNPASVIWETVPFSFLVDWFLNVGQFLSQWSDLLGLRLVDPWTTVSWSVPYARVRYDILINNSWTSVNSSGFWLTRTLGVPVVTLKPRAAKRLSVVRAATAISLLVQALPSRSTDWATRPNPRSSFGD